jgi:hypothetical protein
MATYISREIQKLTGLTRLQVVRFVDLGIVVPHREHEGKGGRRYFNQQNLCEFLLCRELYKYRVGTSTMQTVTLWLRGELFKSQKSSFWGDYKKGRIPEGVFFVLSQSDHITEPPSENFGLWKKKELARVSERCDSMITINLERLIKEAGGL